MLPVRVVVAHHEPLVRGGLRALLERERDIAVVGEVASGEALESRVSELEPDVVVVDVALPGRCDALTATRRIVAARAETRVVMLGGAEPADALFRALRTGASGSSCAGHTRSSCCAPSAASPRGRRAVAPAHAPVDRRARRAARSVPPGWARGL